jgi:WD repeat-containing protein 90
LNGHAIKSTTEGAGAGAQVNAERREVEAVHQVHMGPINCLLVHAGFAVTASDDGRLRVWPLDFRDYLMEANLSVAVTAVRTRSFVCQIA